MAVALGAAAFLLVDPHMWGSGGASAAGGVPGLVKASAAAPAPAPVPAPAPPFALEPRTGAPAKVHFKRQPRAGILFDVGSGRILWSRNPDRRLPVASLTKMMTALIVASDDSPNSRVLVTPQAVHFQGSGIGVLPKGKEVPLRPVFAGLLLVSGNDAAIALAQHTAGSVSGFVSRMNRWAGELGLRCTRYSTPSGIRDRGNYSCARDLAELARADLENPWVAHVVGERHAGFRFPIKGHHLDLYNINPFLLDDTPGITGVKTGYTTAAGRCYVITRRVGGHELGVVLLHSPNPLKQVPALLRAGVRAEG